MKKRIISIITICVLILTIPFMIFAHSGRTDSSGGHKDNKNKSGLGSYHYHCGGYPAHLHSNGVCPYKGGGSTSTSTTMSTTTYATRINAVNVPASVNAGDKVKLEGKVYPSNAVDSSITWSSDNPSVASVSSSGELTAVGVGTVTISAKTSRGTTTRFTVKVNEVFAEKIVIENKLESIFVGDSQSLNVAFTPENTTDKTIVWTSDNDDIATVSIDGMLTGISEGKTIITAVYKDFFDSFEVEVKPVLADKINIKINDVNSKEYNLKKGEKIQFKAEVLPENTTDKTVEWSVSDKNIATIDENGLLTCIESGTVIVTASTVNGVMEEVEVEVSSNADALAGFGVTCAAAGGIALYMRKRKTKKQSN